MMMFYGEFIEKSHIIGASIQTGQATNSNCTRAGRKRKMGAKNGL